MLSGFFDFFSENLVYFHFYFLFEKYTRKLKKSEVFFFKSGNFFQKKTLRFFENLVYFLFYCRHIP